jgi:hypothetical protein
MVAGIAQGAGAGLQRLSPGVYRNPQGQLVGNKGQSLPGQRSQQQRPMPSQQPNVGNVLAGAAQGANQFQPRQPMQPATRPPMPYGQGQEPGMMYTGGTPNFDEIAGQYNNQFQSGFGAGFNGQFNPAMQMDPQQQMGQSLLSKTQDMRQFTPDQMASIAQKRAFVQQQQMGQQYNPMQAPQRIPAQQNMQPQQQYGQPQNMDPNGMAIGPGGQQMTVQQLEQMKAQNPNRFGSIS